MPFCAEGAKRCYITIKLEETAVACRIQGRFILNFEKDLSTVSKVICPQIMGVQKGDNSLSCF